MTRVLCPYCETRTTGYVCWCCGNDVREAHKPLSVSLPDVTKHKVRCLDSRTGWAWRRTDGYSCSCVPCDAPWWARIRRRLFGGFLGHYRLFR